MAIGAAAGLFIFMGLASGCSLDDMIPVKLDPETRAALQDASPSGTDPGPQISLAQADRQRQQLVDHFDYQIEGFNAVLADYDYRVGNAALFRDVTASLLNTGFEIGGTAAAGIPGGGIAASLLVGLGALFISKPGDKAKAQQHTADAVREAVDTEAAKWKEKIQSYNEAARRAKSGEAV
ncbi:MAG: hypothetical protein AAF663_05895 [Planctomycetota bacterium]